MRTRKSIALGMAVVAALLAACSGGSKTDQAATATNTAGAASAGSINIALKEFSVTPSNDSATAGRVNFVAKNDGAVGHELLIVKSDLAAAGLPMKDGAAVDKTKIEVIGEIGGIASGATQSKVFDLKAGRYLLICNLPAHYGAGMAKVFTVK